MSFTVYFGLFILWVSIIRLSLERNTQKIRKGLWCLAVPCTVYTIQGCRGLDSFWACCIMIIALNAGTRYAFFSPAESWPLPRQPSFPSTRSSSIWKIFNLIFNYRLINLPPSAPLKHNGKSWSSSIFNEFKSLVIHMLFLDISTWPLMRILYSYPKLYYRELVDTLSEQYQIPGFMVQVFLISCQGISTYQFTCLIIHTISLIGVGIGLWIPEEWPKIMSKPWLADNLNDFWSRRWHQILREPIKFYLSLIPFKIPRAIYICLFFLISGLIHCPYYYTLTHKFEISLFSWTFGMFGIGCLLERTFLTITNRKVGGLIGRFWVAGWLIFSTRALIENLWNIQVKLLNDSVKQSEMGNGNGIEGSLTDWFWRTYISGLF